MIISTVHWIDKLHSGVLQCDTVYVHPWTLCRVASTSLSFSTVKLSNLHLQQFQLFVPIDWVLMLQSPKTNGMAVRTTFDLRSKTKTYLQNTNSISSSQNCVRLWIISSMNGCRHTECIKQICFIHINFAGLDFLCSFLAMTEKMLHKIRIQTGDHKKLLWNRFILVLVTP